MLLKHSMKHSRRKERQIHALRYFKSGQITGNGKDMKILHKYTHRSCNKNIFNGLVNILKGESGWVWRPAGSSA